MRISHLHITWVALALAGSTAMAREPRSPEPLIFTNEEQVYFSKEAKQPAPPLVSVKVIKVGKAENYTVTGIDPFGKEMPLPASVARSVGGMKKLTKAKTITFDVAGQPLDLRRARPATCWAAIKKATPKPDGKEDWFGGQGIKLHDQGGRALVGDEAAGAPPLILRMRNVIWPAGSASRPSLVLYVHKADSPDRAESYVWADPGAARIGINLRWMQASCTIDGMEAPSPAPSEKSNK